MMKDTYIVREQDVKQFRQQGHVKICNIITPQEYKQFRQMMLLAINKVTSNGDKQNRIDDYSSMFTQVTNIWRVSPDTKSFILQQRFGVQHVRLYHDQALVKQPINQKTPWHQDYFYWPIASNNTVTMWMPLHDCPRQMGTMKFANGSHVNTNIPMMPISQNSQQYFQRIIQQNSLEVGSYDLKAGDATFHYGKTLHSSHANTTKHNRQIITIIYFQDGVKSIPQQQFNQFRKVDLSVFCPNINPSQTINSQLNPIIS